MEELKILKDKNIITEEFFEDIYNKKRKFIHDKMFYKHLGNCKIM